MARLATGLETVTNKELTEQVNLDVRALGAFPLHERTSRGRAEALWGSSE